MANIRQSILIRTDLNLPSGLMAAQIAHIHMQFIRMNCNAGLTLKFAHTLNADDVYAWMKSPYLFVHKVPHLEALDYFEKKALESGVYVATWEDTIYQELAEDCKVAFEMKVGISLGPTDSDKIKLVLGTLPLL